MRSREPNTGTSTAVTKYDWQQKPDLSFKKFLHDLQNYEAACRINE